MSVFRLLAVACLVVQASPAAAQRTRSAAVQREGVLADGARPDVAVVNLAPPGVQLGSAIARLRADLAAAGLVVLPDGALRDALEKPLDRADGAAPLAVARTLLDQARRAYSEFDYATAIARLAELDRGVLSMAPSRAVVALLAERQLLAGQVHLADREPAAAREAFRATAALDPRRTTLDPADHPPDVVAAYAEAIAGRRRTGTLDLPALPPDATVHVDGRPAPASRALPEGVHWVVVTAPAHWPAGAMVPVKAGAASGVELELRRQAPEARAVELRRARPRDDDEVRATAAEVAALAGVASVVVVRRDGDRTRAALYEAAGDALGPFGPLDAARLTPSPSATVTLAGGGRRDDDDGAWYGSWWGRTLLVGGGAAVVGAVIYAVATSRDGGGDDAGVSLGDWCFEGDPCD